MQADFTFEEEVLRRMKNLEKRVIRARREILFMEEVKKLRLRPRPVKGKSLKIEQLTFWSDTEAS